MMIEHFYQCPHCWKKISSLLDSSIPEQNYVEDCENCCNPMVISVKFEERKLVRFSAERLDQ